MLLDQQSAKTGTADTLHSTSTLQLKPVALIVSFGLFPKEKYKVFNG